MSETDAAERGQVRRVTKKSGGADERTCVQEKGCGRNRQTDHRRGDKTIGSTDKEELDRRKMEGYYSTIPIRGAESWWGCSDSDSGSGSALLIDSESGSDPGSDAKYKIRNT